MFLCIFLDLFVVTARNIAIENHSIKQRRIMFFGLCYFYHFGCMLFLKIDAKVKLFSEVSYDDCH